MAQVLLAKTQPLAPTSTTEEDSTSISDGADGGAPPSRPSNPPPYGPPTTPPNVPPSTFLAPPPTATPLTSPIAAHTRSKTTIPNLTNQLSTNQPNPTSPTNLLAPLQEVAGTEGLVRVHVPFSLADLSKIEKRLGNFSANPTQYSKEF